MDPQSHWERVYRTKLPTQVSWYQPHALRSLDLIRRVSPPPNGAIIDVGGGTSTLIDDLLEAGYHDLTVLDLSATALAETRTRLGTEASTVRWIEADILDHPLPHGAYSVWHDRAVFHFITAPAIGRTTSPKSGGPLDLAGSSSWPHSPTMDRRGAADWRSIGTPRRRYMPNSAHHSD